MGRVDSSASARAHAAPSSSRVRKHRPHKIVFESVSQQKKKLRTIISFQANPPPGFTFVPAGHHLQLTQQCKELSRSGGHKVYIVSTSHKKANNITQHVHRIGYHFASTVVHQVTQDLGLSMTRSGHVRLRFGSPVETMLVTESRWNEQGKVTQHQLNAQAQDALMDLFPKMPEADRSRIIGRAFQRGKGKVGTADKLPLARRVQLAVVAHIRHAHTDYDRLLRQVSYDEARRQVQDACLRKLMEWRGDDEDDKVGPAELEDIMREVIVISDSEDEDDEDDERASGPDDVPMVDRDSSVEFISSHPVMQEVVQELVHEPASVGLGRGGSEDHHDNGQPYVLDATAEGGRRYALRPGTVDQKATKRSRRHKKQAGRRKGFHRYSAMDQLQKWAARSRAAAAAAAAPSDNPPLETPAEMMSSNHRLLPPNPQSHGSGLSPTQPMSLSRPNLDAHEGTIHTRASLASTLRTPFPAGNSMHPVRDLDHPPGSRSDGVIVCGFESAIPRTSLARLDDAAESAMASGERRGPWFASAADPQAHVVRVPAMDPSGPARYDADGRRVAAPHAARSEAWGVTGHDHAPMPWELRPPPPRDRRPSLTIVRDDWPTAGPHQQHPATHWEVSPPFMAPLARERQDEPLILVPWDSARPEGSARSRIWDVPAEHHHVDRHRPSHALPDGSLLVRDDRAQPSCYWVERSLPTTRTLPADHASRHGRGHVVEVDGRVRSSTSGLVLVSHHASDHGYPLRDHHVRGPSHGRASERPVYQPSPLRASFSSVPLQESPPDFRVPSVPRSVDHSGSFIARSDTIPGPTSLSRSHHPGRDSFIHLADERERGTPAHPSTIVLVEQGFRSRERTHEVSDPPVPFTTSREHPALRSIRHDSISRPLSTPWASPSHLPPFRADVGSRHAHDLADERTPSSRRESSILDHHGWHVATSARSSVRPLDLVRYASEPEHRRRSSYDSWKQAPPDYRPMPPPSAAEARIGFPLICIPERAAGRHSPTASPRSVIVLE